MSRQILHWPCVKCGKTLNEIDNFILTKYCKECRIKVDRERNRIKNLKRSKKFRESKTNEILYLLKTNGTASIYEIMGFTGASEKSIKQLICILRKRGHRIKASKKGITTWRYYGTRNELV